MTVLIGDIKDIGLSPTEGTVTVFSARTRRANGAGGVITRERRDYPLSGGRFRTGELDPGRTTVELVAPGVFESWTFDLPADGTVSLVDAVELSVDYAPDSAVVNGAAAAAAKAERWAGEAAGSAAVAGRARDEAVAAQASVSRVVESAVTVVRGEFTDLTDRAESAASRAEEARDAAEGSADGAASSAESAAGSVAAAEGHVSAAEESASRAESAEAAAEGHARSAGSHASAAAGSAAAAGGSAAAARDAVGAVNDAASRAQAARVGSEQARDEAVHAAESAKTGAPVGGWEITSLSQGVRESLGRADSALTTVPTATASSAGAVKLAGDLAGTWDAPKVPGLERLMWQMKAMEAQDVLVLKGNTAAQSQVKEELAKRGLNLETVEVLPFKIDASVVTRLVSLFSGFKKLRVAPFVLNTSQVSDMSYMFEGCSALMAVPAMNTNSARDMRGMFDGCLSLESVPTMNTSSVWHMGSMFKSCSSLTSVPSMNTSAATNMTNMFEGCSALPKVPDMDISKVTNVREMLKHCTSLQNGSIRLIRNDGTKPENRYDMIYRSGLTREPFFTPDGQPIN